MNSYNMFIHYLGLASCAAQGAEKGKDENNIPLLLYIANAFGGGFIRDIVLLGVRPWLFTSSALLDIVWVVIIGFLYTHYFFICKPERKQYDTALRLVTITDAFGLGSFICIGMDKAFAYDRNAFIIIMCGYITAVGGGILAKGKTYTKIFTNNAVIRYHLITLLGCCYYYVFRHSFYLVYFTAIGLLFANIDYRTLYNSYPINLTDSCCEVFFLYSVISNKNNNFKKQKIIKAEKKLGICPICPKIYLLQQRIRQC